MAGWRLRSIVIAAVAFGGIFALAYTGLEILNEDPDATHSTSVWHTPLIGLLASAFFFLVFYAVGTARAAKVRQRAVPFGLSVVGALLLFLFWMAPMVSSLVRCFGGGAGC